MVNGQHLNLVIYKGSLELEIYSAVFTQSALQYASYSPIYTHIQPSGTTGVQCLAQRHVNMWRRRGQFQVWCSGSDIPYQPIP